MENINNIKNELNEISPVVAKIGSSNVFTVPKAYFETLDSTILSIVNEPKSAFLADQTQKQPDFQVPEGYFDTLAGNILHKIKLQENISETEYLPEFLQNCRNINVFTVPQNYFETVPQSIVKQIEPGQAKIIPIRRNNFRLFKYAAAAVFTGVLAMGVYKFSKQDSLEHNVPAYVAAGMQIKNVDSALENVKDDEIISYLKDNGENLDVAAVSNTIDASQLPSADDLLNDDAALDKFLNNPGLKN